MPFAALPDLGSTSPTVLSTDLCFGMSARGICTLPSLSLKVMSTSWIKISTTALLSVTLNLHRSPHLGETVSLISLLTYFWPAHLMIACGSLTPPRSAARSPSALIRSITSWLGSLSA